MAKYWVSCIAKREDRIGMLVDARDKGEAREKALKWEYEDIEDSSCFGGIPPDLEIVGVDGRDEQVSLKDGSQDD